MVMDVRKTVILSKAETTYDTDPTPSPTVDAILAQEVDIKENAGIVERDVQWKFLDKLPSLMGEQWVEVSFKVPVIGSGTAGTAPRAGSLLKACGLAETVVSNVSVTYAPTSSNHGSVTLYIYKDGRQHTITGCRGTMKMNFSAGKNLLMEFTLNGRYAAPTVASMPATVTYETTVKVPPVCKSSTFSYNSKTTLVVGTLEFDVANSVVKRMSLNDANAIKGFEIIDRKPVFSVDPEAQFETSFAFRTDWATTQRAVSIVATRAAGNIVTLNIPYGNITKIEYGDRDGIQVEKLDGECSASSGDDSFSIVYT
jgi:hypothetical protein